MVYSKSQVELVYKEEVFQIVGAAMAVHRELGCSFLEAVYQDALEIEFRYRKISFEPQKRFSIMYRDEQLKTYYVPDFYCFGKIIVEIKALQKCGGVEESQIINALKTTKMKVGLLINFGEKSLFHKRYIL